MSISKRKHIYPVLVLILVMSLLCLAGCGKDDKGKEKEDPSSSESAIENSGKVDLTDFTTQDLAGKTVDQSIFKDNEVTMVNFWATFCGPCINEMPDLGDIYRERKGSGFNIVGVVTDVQYDDYSINDETLAAADKIVAETKADYMQLMVSEDIDKDMTDPYQINAIPTTFFVDSKGQVIDGPYVGGRSKDDWESIIDGVMK